MKKFKLEVNLNLIEEVKANSLSEAIRDMVKYLEEAKEFKLVKGLNFKYVKSFTINEYKEENENGKK